MTAPWQDAHPVIAGHPDVHKFGQEALKARARQRQELSAVREQGQTLAAADGGRLISDCGWRQQDERRDERERHKAWLHEHAAELLEQLRKAEDRLLADVFAHVDGRRTNRGLAALVVEAQQLRSAYNLLAPALGLRQDLRPSEPDPAGLLRQVSDGTPLLPPSKPAPPVHEVVDDLTPRQVAL